MNAAKIRPNMVPMRTPTFDPAAIPTSGDKMKIYMAFLACALPVAGCASRGDGRSTVGAATGAVVNGITGDQDGSGKVAAAIISAMQGGLVGGTVGADLSRGERRTALEAEYRALEYTPGGQTVTWGDKQSGRYGEVVAASPYRVGSQDCRQYAHTVYAGGQPKRARGTACRNADGSWTPLT
jgi:surface antigen